MKFFKIHNQQKLNNMKKVILTAVACVAVGIMSFNYIGSTYTVDTGSSEVKWTGYHLAKSYEHSGDIKLKSGNILVEDGKITGGSFVIDMNSISNADITDEKKNAKLVGHLKSEDFFAVEKYAEAKLEIKSVEGSKAKAEITIRGISNNIEFDFNVDEMTDNKIAASATIKIDRTVHEVMYGWTLENAMLSNEFKLDVKIVANK